jgi:RHS repeat-associated protein
LSIPAARKISYRYDSLNRLVSTTFGDGSPAITRDYTADGLPNTITSDGAKWTNTYNRRRLNEQEKLSYGGVDYTFDRRYDAHGSLLRVRYPQDTVWTEYSPNALGEARQVGTYATAITYAPTGAITSFRYGNGILHQMTPNRRGLPEWSEDTGVLKDKYEYDANGNVTAIADWLEGISNRGMSYDALDRLLSVNSTQVWGDASYTYDALDNLTSSQLTTGPNARYLVHTFDPKTNLLASVTNSGGSGYNYSFLYDDFGNVKQRGSQQFVFDLGNRLRRAPNKGTYVYDGLGHRVSVIGPDGINRIQVYSQEGQLLFVKASNAPTGTKYIHLHNHVIAEGTGNSVQYDHTDGLGSPVARTDATGKLISRTRYEPYGATAAGAVPVLGYGGHVNVADLGLVYMQQRYYDPVAGRFLSIDPVVTDSNSGSSFNRYAYASNSPYKYFDPDGRQERAAEAFSDQYRNDFASGNSRVYDPFVVPAAIVTGAMLVGPPIAAAAIASAPAEAAVAAGAAGKATTIVAKNGVEIKSMARHAVDRAIGDGGKRASVGPKEILDSLKNPLKITETKTDALGRASQRFIGKDATTAVNPETGKIVSVNPTSTKTAEKLIKAAEQ